MDPEKLRAMREKFPDASDDDIIRMAANAPPIISGPLSSSPEPGFETASGGTFKPGTVDATGLRAAKQPGAALQAPVRNIDPRTNRDKLDPLNPLNSAQETADTQATADRMFGTSVGRNTGGVGLPAKPLPDETSAEYHRRLIELGIGDPELRDKLAAQYRKDPLSGLTDRLEMAQVSNTIKKGEVQQEYLDKKASYQETLPPVIMDTANQLRDQERIRLDARKQADDNYKNQLAQLDAGVNELFATHINPERYFETGQGNRAISAIAVGLGEFANQVTGHGNAALKIVQDAVNNDIDAQKADVNAKYMALGIKGNLVNRFHDRFGDIDQAAAAAKAAMYENLAMYTEYLGAQDGTAQAVAAAKRQAQELRALSQEARMAYDIKAQARSQAEYERLVMQANAAAAAQNAKNAEYENWLNEGEGSGEEEPGVWADMTDKQQENIASFEIEGPTGKTEVVEGFFRSSKDKEAALKVAQAYKQIHRELKALSDLRGYAAPTSQKSDEANLIMSRLRLAYIELNQGLGKNITKDDQEGELLGGALKGLDPTDLLTFNTDAKIRNVDNAMRQKVIDMTDHLMVRTPIQDFVNSDGQVVTRRLVKNPTRSKPVPGVPKKDRPKDTKDEAGIAPSRSYVTPGVDEGG